MIEAARKFHRILAPRLVVTIGAASPEGRKNIIPIIPYFKDTEL